MLNQVLNLIQDLRFQHLIKPNSYETLKRVQGDKIAIATQSPVEEGIGLDKMDCFPSPIHSLPREEGMPF